MGNTVEEWRAGSGGLHWKCVLMTHRKDTSPWFQLLVTAVLLVIGGIEMNPGPHKVRLCYFLLKEIQ